MLVTPITSSFELDRLIQTLIPVEEVYLDTEADSLHHYQEKVCLLQFTLPAVDGLTGENFLVDPLAGLDLRPLLEVLGEKLLILHGADYDLRILRRDFGFRARAIFDTMLAARLAGHTALGLDALVQRYVGVSLDHGAQKTDWSRRPLTDRQLKYAVEDTAYLPTITQNLRTELQHLGRSEWHRQQCQQLIELTATDRERDPDQIWRIKGSSKLDAKGQTILRELWQWRNAEARSWDRPTFMVCSNAKLLELAMWSREHSGKDILHSKKIPHQWSSSRKKSLRRALERAAGLPPEEWAQPPPRGERPPFDPHFSPRLSRLREVRNQIATSLNLEASILAPLSQLEALAACPPRNLNEFSRVEKWLPWQTEILGGAFLRALELGGGNLGVSSVL